MAISLSGEVRTQNAPYLLRSILLNTEGRERAWTFLKEHWEDDGQAVSGQLYRAHVRRHRLPCHSSARSRRDRLFLPHHPVKQGAKQIEQHLERLRIAVASQARWKGLLRS